MKVPGYFDGGDQNLYQDELNQAMQGSISDNGFVIPSQDTATVTDLSATMPNGTQWYDSEDNELKVKKNGIVHIIQTVPA